MGANASQRFVGRMHRVVRIALLMTCCSSAQAEHDIEFVAEHLPEVAMDNRYASLPLGSSAISADQPWSFAVQAGYATTSSGELTIEGPMFSVGVDTRLSDRWTLGGFVFVDPLRLTGDHDFRPLQTLFAPDTPIA